MDSLSTNDYPPKGSNLAVQPTSPETIKVVDGPIIPISNSSIEPQLTGTGADDPREVEVVAIDISVHSSEAQDGTSETTTQNNGGSDTLTEGLSVTEVESNEESRGIIGQEKVGLRKTKGDNESKIDTGNDEKNGSRAITMHTKNSPNVCAASSSVEVPLHKANACDEGAIPQLQANTFEAPTTTPEAKNLRDLTLMLTRNITDTADEDSTVGAVDSSKPKCITPPRLRPTNLTPATHPSGLRGLNVPAAVPDTPKYAFMPRAPRSHHVNNAFRGNDSEEAVRLNAQLMKLRNELEAERKKSASMRQCVEDEMKTIMDTALINCTTDMLNKQFETLAQQSRVEAKERDLLFREACIGQMEIFLSEGQKYVYRQSRRAEKTEGIPLTMAEVHREHEHRKAELVAQKNISDREGELESRLQALQLRENAQQMREQQYKVLIRAGSECEASDKSVPNMEAKLNEVADVEYNRGFGAGKVAGRASAEKDAREQGFLEGYSACHCDQAALSKLRQGLIARDSPELDFLYDSAHSHNLFTVGMKVGGRNVGKEKKPVMNQVQAQVEKKPVQEHVKPEESVGKLHVARPTFATELRGALNMHNGQNGHNGYEGKRMVKDEEAQGESLIDLY